MRCWKCELRRVAKCELRFFRVGQRSSACSQGGAAPATRGHLGGSHCRSRAGFVVCGVIAVVVTSASLHATSDQRACCERPPLRLPAASGARDLHPASMMYVLRSSSSCSQFLRRLVVGPRSRRRFSSSLSDSRRAVVPAPSAHQPASSARRRCAPSAMPARCALCTCTWNPHARIEAGGSRVPPRTRRGRFCMGMGGNNAAVPHFLRSGTAQLTQWFRTAVQKAKPNGKLT